MHGTTVSCRIHYYTTWHTCNCIMNHNMHTYYVSYQYALNSWHAPIEIAYLSNQLAPTARMPQRRNPLGLPTLWTQPLPSPFFTQLFSFPTYHVNWCLYFFVFVFVFFVFVVVVVVVDVVVVFIVFVVVVVFVVFVVFIFIFCCPCCFCCCCFSRYSCYCCRYSQFSGCSRSCRSQRIRPCCWSSSKFVEWVSGNAFLYRNGEVHIGLLE